MASLELSTEWILGIHIWAFIHLVTFLTTRGATYGLVLGLASAVYLVLVLR